LTTYNKVQCILSYPIGYYPSVTLDNAALTMQHKIWTFNSWCWWYPTRRQLSELFDRDIFVNGNWNWNWKRDNFVNGNEKL